jgi:hypothetical protein
MTKPDQFDHSEETSEGRVLLKRALIGTVAGLSLVLMAGVFAGYLSAAIEHGGPSLIDAIILACIAGLIALIAYGGWRFWPATSGEPIANSTRKGARILFAMCGLGMVIGFAFAASEESGSLSLFSNGPIGTVTAAVAIAGWTIAVPVLTWMWWRTVDEHETAVYAESSLISFHIYLIGAPTWWLATRAGWLPAQDPMIVWLVVAIVWTVIWLYRRYF